MQLKGLNKKLGKVMAEMRAEWRMEEKQWEESLSGKSGWVIFNKGNGPHIYPEGIPMIKDNMKWNPECIRPLPKQYVKDYLTLRKAKKELAKLSEHFYNKVWKKSK